MTLRQVVRRRVDFPPILGPVSSITLELRSMSLGIMLMLVRQGCLALMMLNPFDMKVGLFPCI